MKKKGISFRLFAIMLTISMMFSLVIIPIQAEAEEEESVLYVGSLADWQTLQNRCKTETGTKSLTVVLTTDIDFSTVIWEPTLGEFYGIFEGGNHVLSGLQQCEHPIFHENHGTIKNLIIKDSEFLAGDEYLS